MVWRRCSHKTLADFSRQADGARLWTCSACGVIGRWSESWGYHGSLECKVCWQADISWVSCSEACMKAYGAPKPAVRAKRAPVPRKPRQDVAALGSDD
jgi:hypothetical protein